MPNLNTYGFVSYEDIASQRVADGNVRVVNQGYPRQCRESQSDGDGGAGGINRAQPSRCAGSR